MIRLFLLLLVLMTGVITYLVLQLIRTEKRLKELENKPKESKEFSEQNKSVIRHDLKGTLNRIFALTRLIPMSGPVNDAQKEYLQKIEEQCSSGREAINQALPRNPGT